MRDLLNYRADGVLVWKARTGDACKNQWAANVWNARYADRQAGTIGPAGYLRVSIRKRLIYAHQIVWELHNGPAPKGMVIDHINHNKLDNRIENLRLVSRRANSLNMGLRGTNTSGVCGVRWNRAKQKWFASITVHGKTIHLGCFASKDDAARARAEANRAYGFHENHGIAAVA